MEIVFVVQHGQPYTKWPRSQLPAGHRDEGMY